MIEIVAVSAAGAEHGVVMSGETAVVRSGVLTTPPSDLEARVRTTWRLPDGSQAARLRISDSEGRPLFLHLVRHVFAPTTFGPESAFVLDGASLCVRDGTPIRFNDGATGYFADVYAELPDVEFEISTSAQSPER